MTQTSTPAALIAETAAVIDDIAIRQAERAAHDAFRIKAPTKRAAAIAAALTTLATQAEVDAFTRTLRIRAGVQDVALLPESTWTIVQVEDRKETGRANTAVLLSILAASTTVRIDWPSVTFHWGVAVSYVQGDVHYVARSADYAVSETYLSS